MNNYGRYFQVTRAAGEPWQLPADNFRTALYVSNISAGTCRIAFGSEASAANGFLLAANTALPFFDNPESCPTNYMSVWCVSGPLTLQGLTVSRSTTMPGFR